MRLHRLLFVALLSAAGTAGTIGAQPTFRLPKSKRDNVIIDGQSLPAARTMDPTVLGALLSTLHIDEVSRQALEATLGRMFAADSVSKTNVTTALTNAGASAAEAAFIAQTLVDFIATKDPKGTNAVLSSVTAAATTDRLYSTVELYSFTGSHFSAKVVSATAVSNADTAVDNKDTLATQKLRDFRERTAQFLTALNDGGPIAVHLAANVGRSTPDRRFGWSAALAGTAARAGTLTTSDNVLYGGLFEGKLFAQEMPTAANPEPSQVQITLRTGIRHAGGSALILGDPRTHTMRFVQGMFEGRAPFAKVPIGVTITNVNGPFKPYAVTFQVYGVAGF